MVNLDRHGVVSFLRRYMVSLNRRKVVNLTGVCIHDYTNGKGFSIDEVRTQVRDAFKVETEFIKSGKLVFDFRDIGSDMLRYRNIVEHYLTTEYKDNDWEVFIYSADNTEWD